MPPTDEEVFEAPFPGPEALRPHIGNVVAYDSATGEVRDSASTWEELLGRCTDQMLDGLRLLYVPGTRFIT
ncbi:MAG: hypothetical protein HY901_17320 [Deltaproteobacteria bacterium]|nr:hypothetical protein [Deltaproteobacteria bacterium]